MQEHPVGGLMLRGLVIALAGGLILQCLLLISTILIPTTDFVIGTPIPFGTVSLTFTGSSSSYPGAGALFVADIALTALPLWLIRQFVGDTGALVATLAALVSVVLAALMYVNNPPFVGLPLPISTSSTRLIDPLVL
jgi:hypothetical protein